MVCPGRGMYECRGGALYVGQLGGTGPCLSSSAEALSIYFSLEAASLLLMEAA